MTECGFSERSVASLASYVNGYPFKPDHHAREGVPIVRIRQLNDPTAEMDYYEGSIPPENHIDTGDLIFSWSGSLSVREWDRGFAYLNQHLFKVLPREGIDQRWLRWALDYSLPLFEPYMHGSAMTHITRPMLRDVRVPTPPVEEQRRIADFLDDHVARIDELIQLRVRQQTLHQAKYLEQVRRLTSHGAPSTWRVAHAFMTGSGTTPKSDHPEYFEGATPWVMSGDLNDGFVNATEKTVSAEALKVYSALKVYPPGTLLVAMYGATVGRTGRLGVPACVNQAVCALQERGPVSAEYAQYWFVGRRTEIIELASGGGQPNISQEIVRNLRITTGDENWQRERIHSIRTVATQIEDIISTGMRSVDLLEERKRALITAAVTGELDVTTAKPIGMGKWVPNVGASVEAAAATQSNSIGGIG